jgi:hypothetical protein
MVENKLRAIVCIPRPALREANQSGPKRDPSQVTVMVPVIEEGWFVHL